MKESRSASAIVPTVRHADHTQLSAKWPLIAHVDIGGCVSPQPSWENFRGLGSREFSFGRSSRVAPRVDPG
jgi:hypothetical protein